MTTSASFDEMSGSELLDTVGVLAAEVRRGEVRVLLAAAAWAVLNGPDTIDPEVARLPGRERPRLYGGPGTPYVASFAGAQFGARLGLSTYAGEQEIAAALDLQHRLPQLWSRVEALEVRASYAKYVARRTRELPIAHAGYVDSRVVESADGRITWSQFTDLVDAAIIAADPDAAAAREEAARRARFARPTRSTEHGMRGFYLFTDTAGIARLDATVAYLADAMNALGMDGNCDERRAWAMVLLADPARAARFLADYATWRQRPTDPTPPENDTDTEPEPGPDDHSSGPVRDAITLFGSSTTGQRPVIDWDKVLPRLTLHLHCYAGTTTTTTTTTTTASPDPTGVARLEGVGPLTEAWVRRRLGEGAKVTIRPVFHPLAQAPVQAWEIPDRHRQAVSVMTPADVFPFGSSVVDQTHGWGGMQIDHTDAWQPADPDAPGEPPGSRIGNYGPMTRLHHLIKTHGRWDVKQPFPGIYLWRDPHGATYLVDHTGTRHLHTPIRIDLVNYPAA